MYLPLAAVMVLVALGVFWLAGRASGPRVPWLRWRVLIPIAILLSVFGSLTASRIRDYRTDFSIWQDTIDKWPTHPGAWNNLGVAHFHKERFEEAIPYFRKALEILPNYAEAHNNLGNALARTKKYEEALPHYRRAVALKPEFGEAWNNLGNALSQLGRQEESLGIYRHALDISPNRPDIHQGLGAVLLGMGRIEDAIAEFDKALALNPDHAKALSNLGAALVLQNKPAEAIARCRQALELDPGQTEALFNLAKAYAQSGQPARAVEYYRKFVQIQGEDAEARFNLGQALMQTGSITEAIHEWEEALNQDPRFIPAQLELAWVLATCPEPSIRDGSKALALVERAQGLMGEVDARSLEVSAAAEAEAGHFARADELVAQALQLARSQGDETISARLRREMESYRAQAAFRDPDMSATAK
jgi:tetratricopeptide (TPR) repeat protein